MMKIQHIIIGIVMFLGSGSWGASSIQIGMSAAMSGASQQLGKSFYQGAMTYFNEVNRQGGINGRTVNVVLYDDAYDPLSAVKNTVRLIEKDNITLLYGYVGTPTVTRVLPILSRYKSKNVLLFCPLTGAQPQREWPYRDYVYNLRASYQQETAALVDHFVQLNRKRIAIFYQSDSYGRSGWSGVVKALSKYQLSIVQETTYQRGDSFGSSYQEQVRILNDAKPDAIILIGSYQACAGFIRDVRDVGISVPIANISFVGSESLLSLLIAEEEKSGKNYTKNLINSQVVPHYEDLTIPAVREYRQLFTKYHRDSDYSFVSLEGFLSAKLLVTILQNAGADFTQQSLINSIHSMGTIDIGLNETLMLSEDKHQAMDKVYFTTVKNNQFLPIEDWQQWEN